MILTANLVVCVCIVLYFSFSIAQRNDSLQTLSLFIRFDQLELNVSNCKTNKMPPLKGLCKDAMKII